MKKVKAIIPINRYAELDKTAHWNLWPLDTIFLPLRFLTIFLVFIMVNSIYQIVYLWVQLRIVFFETSALKLIPKWRWYVQYPARKLGHFVCCTVYILYRAVLISTQDTVLKRWRKIFCNNIYNIKLVCGRGSAMQWMCV